jgi:two-component system response regulator NreC
MNTPKLKSYFGLPDSEKAKRFFEALLEIERVDGTFWGVVDLSNPFHHVYLSQSVEVRLGYPLERYYTSQKFEFLVSITPQELLPVISSRQAQYGKEALSPDFDFVAPQFMNFQSSLIASSGRDVPITYDAVVLDYTEGGIMNTLIGVYWDNSIIGKEQLLQGQKKILSLFKELKKIYVEFFPEKFSAIKAHHVPLVQVYFPTERPDKKPTDKELVILKLLGQGLTAREISRQEGISFNTVETHRKHLLEKFKASNVAELINKASKVYWLE